MKWCCDVGYCTCSAASMLLWHVPIHVRADSIMILKPKVIHLWVSSYFKHDSVTLWERYQPNTLRITTLHTGYCTCIAWIIEKWVAGRWSQRKLYLTSEMSLTHGQPAISHNLEWRPTASGEAEEKQSCQRLPLKVWRLKVTGHFAEANHFSLPQV